ncbi:carboxypeptidase-like regulatory domain-containing protein [Carboxylicivirga linearis]|uniref:Carboxypeptidase-like regulatory domain-containing protein n=1 Tax=Carboxylicivirga linearis TaxID=1628157 RepID=A0ABS5JVG2_9BACT|nr:carboxypeptidase-like regulatory domain-containing protein [Carboxylicivirga linearis]MBS2098877.1 carboxypeptidase-like regulatory domain-containing protein [Carboxylicivirga linearis]
MKTNPLISNPVNRVLTLLIIALFVSGNIFASNLLRNQEQTDTLSFKTVKGKIMDSDNGSPLVFANLAVEGTNIATVSNSEGDFSLKVPKEMLSKKLSVSYIGYQSKSFTISDLKEDRNKIKLDLLTVSLDAINVFPKDPYLLIQAVLKRRQQNYVQDESLMTAFYRETIKNRRKYASLSEAVVEVYKHSYGNERQDVVRLMKGRKSADYSKLDTLVFKLQGGPYSTLMLDIMKNPYMILDYDVINDYDFSIANVTREDNRLLYVLEFAQQKWVKEPLFYGKLYIDAESLAIVNATYNINTEDKVAVGRMFIKRKPMGAEVYPTEASYMVSYREKDGKWIYGYSRGELTFKVKWKKRLFNSVYHTGIEMAVTDWKPTNEKPFKGSDRMKMNVVMSDTQMGFTDDNFWGTYNVIEPEKSIESAIKKIQKNLEKLEH